MKKSWTGSKAWVLGLALMGGVITAPAHAALTMTITDSGGSSTVYGPSSSSITVVDEIGLFAVEVHTAASNAGSGNLAEMVTTSLNITSSGADFFTVSVTEDDFMIPTPNDDGLAQFMSIVNASTSTGGASYNARTYIDGVELLNVADIADTGTYTDSDSLPIGTPFSVTHEFRITTTGSGQTVSFDLSTRAIPAPGVLGLMGLGLVGLAFAGRRRRNALAV